MARPSLSEVRSSMDALLPDNTTGDISPADVRSVINSFIEAVAPAYGYLTQVTNRNVTANITPVPLVYDQAFVSPLVDYTVAAAQGTVTRLEKGVTTMQFTADVVSLNNRIITFTLYADGVATSWRQSVTMTSSTDLVSLSFTAIQSFTTPNTVYEIRVSANVNGTVVTLSNVAFVVSSQTVNVYT